MQVLCCGACGSLGQNAQCLPTCRSYSPTAHIFEVQLHHQAILQLDEDAHSHEPYEFLRSMMKV